MDLNFFFSAGGWDGIRWGGVVKLSVNFSKKPGRFEIHAYFRI